MLKAWSALRSHQEAQASQNGETVQSCWAAWSVICNPERGCYCKHFSNSFVSFFVTGLLFPFRWCYAVMLQLLLCICEFLYVLMKLCYHHPYIWLGNTSQEGRKLNFRRHSSAVVGCVSSPHYIYGKEILSCVILLQAWTLLLYKVKLKWRIDPL